MAACVVGGVQADAELRWVSGCWWLCESLRRGLMVELCFGRCCFRGRERLPAAAS